jgi:hypothetical protein
MTAVGFRSIAAITDPQDVEAGFVTPPIPPPTAPLPNSDSCSDLSRVLSSLGIEDDFPTLRLTSHPRAASSHAPEEETPPPRIFRPMNPRIEGGTKTAFEGRDILCMQTYMRSRINWPGRFAACLSEIAALTSQLETDRLSRKKYIPGQCPVTKLRDDLIVFIDSYHRQDRTIPTPETLQLLNKTIADLERETKDLEFMEYDASFAQDVYFTLVQISGRFQEKCRHFFEEVMDLTSQVASQIMLQTFAPAQSVLLNQRSRYLPCLEAYANSLNGKAIRYLKRNGSYLLALLNIEKAKLETLQHDTSPTDRLIQLVTPHAPG